MLIPVLRTVIPEVLDTLPPSSPEAKRSRRDLVLINSLMANGRWLKKTLQRQARANDSTLEIGAGTGENARIIGAALGTGAQMTGLDLLPRPEGWPASWRWEETDVLEYGGFAEHKVVFANLFLHHFTPDQLAELGRRMQQGTRLILANEPARRRLHWMQAKSLALLGVNSVTRHDAPASVHAGFLGNELPNALELSPERWSISIHTTMLGAYRMIAKRIGI